MFRPTEYLPLPREVSTNATDPCHPCPCPCTIFTQLHPTATGEDARTKPFYEVSQDPGSAYTSGVVAQKSIDRLQALDAHPNIFICLAHDDILFDTLPLFNDDPTKDINDWNNRGYKEYCRWAFLDELPKDGKPSREPLVVGLWREGKRVTWSKEEGFVDVAQ